jgi:uncharacterized protein YcfJ
MSDEIATWIKDMRRETMKTVTITNNTKDDVTVTFDEIGGWINEAKRAGLDVSTYEYDFNKPKRKSWIEKIRDYDNVYARMQSAEAMKDHYKTVFSETRNELVKQRSIINENNKILGRRLKFSVGHNHIEIIVGNPVTYAKNISSDGKKIEWDISRCSHKDVYDWKLGVRMALDNLCDDRKYSDKLRRDLRKELARKYPEVFEVKK